MKNKNKKVIFILIILVGVGGFFIFNDKTCKEGSTFCSNGNLKICSNGVGRLTEVCELGCKNDACITPPDCKECKESTEWGNCFFGKQKRTIYKCSESTDFECNALKQKKICGSDQVRILVIPVTTKDIPIPEYATKDYLNNLFFGDDGYSFNNYYEQNSYGQFSISGDVMDWVVLESYSSDYSGKQGKLIALDTITKVDLEISLSSFDGDNNGYIDLVFFITPDKLLENAGYRYHFTYLAFSDFIKNNYGLVDGKDLSSFMIGELTDTIPDQTRGRIHAIRYGVFLHVLGHILPFRSYGRELPYYGDLALHDLYNRPNEWIRDYGLMSEGGSAEYGASHFSGYTKMKIGWLNPVKVNYGEEKKIRIYKTEESYPYTSNTKLIKVPMSTTNENLYYLLEWRYVEEFDTGHNFDTTLMIRATRNETFKYAKQGLVIYRVDDSISPEIVGDGGIIQIVSQKRQIYSDIEDLFFRQSIPYAFGTGTGILKFTSEEGIIIEITNIADDNTYADIEITYT